ncbi:MAG TPA: helix-turn-helix transcriptional regulator [Candidatus Baltobacteraceae bacterium]|nr:helix-turn-helix transcriptional regulator [Candidatus Baltobacteraceae bacterium]
MDSKDAAISATPADLNGRAAARIRATREAAGLSQGDLAARAGLSRPSLANIEAGRQTITLRQLGAIAYALRIRAADLLL